MSRHCSQARGRQRVCIAASHCAPRNNVGPNPSRRMFNHQSLRCQRMNGDDHAGLHSRARLLEHFEAAPVEDRRVLRVPQVTAPDHVVEVASSRRGLDVRRITPGEENGTTEHNAMNLLKRKVTAQGRNTAAADRHLRRRQSEHSRETRARRPSATRSLDTAGAYQKFFARRRSRAPRCSGTGAQSFNTLLANLTGHSAHYMRVPNSRLSRLLPASHTFV